MTTQNHSRDADQIGGLVDTITESIGLWTEDMRVMDRVVEHLTHVDAAEYTRLSDAVGVLAGLFVDVGHAAGELDADPFPPKCPTCRTLYAT